MGRFDFREGEADAEHGLPVNDFGLRTKCFVSVGDLNSHCAVNGPHLLSADVAAGEAKVADDLFHMSGRLHVRQFDGSNQGIPARAWVIEGQAFSDWVLSYRRVDSLPLAIARAGLTGHSRTPTYESCFFFDATGACGKH